MQSKVAFFCCFFATKIENLCYNIHVIEKFKGIILKLSDYKDADKLATIFSLEEGLLVAKFSGVKKDKAKFKAVAQPFVFGSFVVAQKGKTLTITQADMIDAFTGILSNYNKTICAYIVLDIVRSTMPAQKPEQDLFLLTLNCLKEIEQQNEFFALAQYILNYMKFSGVQLNVPEADYAFLDLLSGNFVSVRQENSLAIDKKVYSTLKQINSATQNSAAANPPQPEVLKQTLRLLNKVIYLKFGTEIKSFQFI